VRPTDENQSSSRRPNLMSPARRSSGEIHILAMLDGRAGGRRKRGPPGLRWYGAGAMLACTLLAALAWLVHGAPVRDATPAVVAAALPAAQAAPTAPATSAIRVTVAPTIGEPQNPRAQAAAVDVSASPDASSAPEANTAPEARTAVAVHGAHIVDLTPPARAVPAPAPRLAALAAPLRQQPAYRHLPHAAPSPSGSQSAARPPSPARADLPPARHKRGQATVRTPSAPPASVDTDVAVISAILQHAGADAADAVPSAACGDKPCGPRMPSR